MAEPITVTGLTKTYPGSSSPALASVSLSVEPGTFLVLLGPSGSGKTTLLRCLAGIERIDSGTITIGGRRVAAERAHVPPEQRDLSMVFQDYALWPHMTALDNVAFALRRRRLARAQCRSRALSMLDRVGLAEFAGRYPNELSGGQQQRVALARALIAHTGLILCDEPLSNLDADLRERMRVEISSLVREVGATTVYITHDQAEAFALADKVGVLEEGRLVQFGSPEDIYFHPATPFVARFTGLAGELRVKVVGAGDDGLVEVTAPGCVFPRLRPGGVPGSAAASLEPGAEAVLAIRPTGVYVAGAGAGAGAGEGGAVAGAVAGAGAGASEGGAVAGAVAGAGAGASEGGQRHLTGRVADVAFRGRGYELAIDLPGHGRLTGVFARHRTARGEEVALRLEPDGCHLLPVGPAHTVDDIGTANGPVGAVGAFGAGASAGDRVGSPGGRPDR